MKTKKTDAEKSSTTTLKYTKSIKNFRKFNSPKNYYEAWQLVALLKKVVVKSAYICLAVAHL